MRQLVLYRLPLDDICLPLLQQFPQLLVVHPPRWLPLGQLLDQSAQLVAEECAPLRQQGVYRVCFLGEGG